MVIYGGCSNNYALLSDVWEYKVKGNTWTLLWEWNFTATAGPSPREGHAAEFGAATYDEKKNPMEMYVYGGITEAYVPLEEMWKFDYEAKTWTDLTASVRDSSTEGLPAARWLHTMVGVKGGTEFIIFGGCSRTFGPLDDTWRYLVKENKFVLLTPDFTLGTYSGSFPPPARFLHTAVPLLSAPSVAGQTPEQRMLVFGGAANNVDMADAWILDIADGTWVEDYPTSDRPMARQGHSMTWIASPAMKETIVTATKQLMGNSTSSTSDEKAKKMRFASSTGRRLLSKVGESFPYVQGSGEAPPVGEPGSDPPWAQPLPVQKSETTRQADFLDTQKSSTTNYWFVVFGGKSERGNAVSASAGSASLY